MGRRPAGSAALVLIDAATPLHPEPALFDAMIEGWCRQHAARRLSPTITRSRVGVVRRFQAFCGAWPWQWRAALAHLGARLPAAMLSRLLGLTPNTAVRWARVAGGDWNTYAAQIARRA